MADATCPSSGSKSGTTCTFFRKLCVTCVQDASGVVTIRAQTNGLPNHCFFSPKDTAADVEVDFSATWLPSASGVQSAADVSTQSEVNSLICNIVRSADTNIPSASKYVNNAGAAQNTAWGVSVTGVLMFSSSSAEGVDPFYPAAYGSVTDPSTVTEKVDGCMSHPQV
jgi:hypothetical protein